MADRIHSVLAPSAASRWINCPGSVHATLELQTGADTGSAYAHEGTAAHKLLELCMRLHCAPDELKGAQVHRYTDQAGKEVGHNVNEDMIDAVGQAYDYITSWQAAHPNGKVFIERQVHWGAHPACNLSKEHSSGTADIVLISLDEVEVIDYKHGAGVVVLALDNEQLKLYGVGALHDPQMVSPALRKRIKQIKLVIIQPRARHSTGPIRETTESVKDLDAWVKAEVAPSARKALRPNAPRMAGKWCRWCTAAPTCRALVDKVMEEAGAEFESLEQEPPRDPQRLSTAELSRAMAAADMIEAWAHAVRGRVLAMLLAGRELPGWKLVSGRSTRKWREDDTSDVIKQAHDVLRDPSVYAPRVLLSPAKMEEAYKDARPDGVKVKDRLAQFNSAFGRYIEKSTPAPHVAPEDDPRPSYTPGSEFDPLQ
jgi:hypothetical protein